MTNRTFLVRHGSHDYGWGDLTRNGVRQSEKAAHTLLESNLGSTAIIYASAEARAMQTAKIIASVLGVGTFVSDEIMAIAGKYPDSVEDLDKTIDTGLAKHGITADDKDLVIVTHEPLVAYVAHGYGNPEEHVDNGFVHEYAHDWTSQRYKRDSFAFMLEDLLA